MRTFDRLALTRATETGYLLADAEVSWMAQETWYLLCCERSIPCVSILGHHPQRTIVLDTQSVVEGIAQARVPLLTPTERTRQAVERLVRKYAQPRERAKVGAYTALYGVWESSAEEVARELLKVWDEAKYFVELQSLWEAV